MIILFFILAFILIIGYGVLGIRQNSKLKMLYASISLAVLFIVFGIFAYAVTSFEFVSY